MQFLDGKISKSELATRLVSKVVDRTPTRKDIPGDVNKGGGGTLQKGWEIGRVTRIGGEYTIEVFNPVHYAPHVEHGHRGVYVPQMGVTMHTDTKFTPGVHMLKISVEELKNDVQGILERRLDRFLKDVVNDE